MLPSSEIENVQILISTYNGEKYISQQMDSLLSQTYRYVSLLIRDDGSTDKTKEIIQSYASQFPDRITFIKGDNLGVVSSFLYLLQLSNPESSYFCFCDQDDIWLPDKIERAVEQLKSIHGPGMVFTSTKQVTEDLRLISLWPRSIRKPPSFCNALVQNIAVGATITMNRAARQLLGQAKMDARDLLMHDWWTYLVVSAFGKAIFDPVPSILYRQHAGNTIGGNVSAAGVLKKKWKSFLKHRGKRLLIKQASAFHESYGRQLDFDKNKELIAFIQSRGGTLARIRYAFTTKLYRQSRLDNLLMRLLLLVGYI